MRTTNKKTIRIQCEKFPYCDFLCRCLLSALQQKKLDPSIKLSPPTFAEGTKRMG